MEIPTVEAIVETIDAFLARHGNMPHTRFGRDATRNANIVTDLRNGHEPSLAVLRRLKTFMEMKDAELLHDGGDTAAAQQASPGNDKSFSPQVQHG